MKKSKDKAKAPNPQAARRRAFIINVTMPLDLDEFLQEVGNRTRREGGYHVSKAMIMRAMARVLKQLHESGRLNLNKLFDEEQLIERIRKALSSS